MVEPVLSTTAKKKVMEQENNMLKTEQQEGIQMNLGLNVNLLLFFAKNQMCFSAFVSNL